MSNLDPTHTIPLLVAGALQSGLAFTFLPRAGGFALMISEPAEPFTDAEIECHAQVSAIADVDMAALSTLELSYQLGIATKRLAGHLVSEGAAQVDDADLTPDEREMADELSRTTPFESEVILQAVLAARDSDVSAQAILDAFAVQPSGGALDAYSMDHGMPWSEYSAQLQGAIGPTTGGITPQHEATYARKTGAND